MAKSKFLEYQDKNNDKLIDVCGTQIITPEEPECKECIPNSAADLPDWKTTEEISWFNGQKCTYETRIDTPLTSLSPSEESTDEEANDFILSVFESYKDAAIRNLLEGSNKINNESSRETIINFIENEKYALDLRDASRVQILYSIPHKYFAPLTDVGETLEEPEESDPEETDSESSTGIVEFEVDNLETVNQKLRQIRFALYLYNVYYNIDKALHAKTLIYEQSEKLFDLSLYGDATILPNSAFSKIVPNLDKFLNDKKLDFPQAGIIGTGLFKDKAISLKFQFSANYAKLTKLEVTLEGCSDVKTYSGDSLSYLNTSSGFKDPTAIHYFSKVHEMHRDLTARTPIDWKEFVIKYTNPIIVEKENYKQDVDDFSDTGASCMTDALKTEGVQLGFDALNEVFSLADAITYQFNKSACKTPSELEAIAIETGAILDPELTAAPASTALTAPPPTANPTLYALAQERAFKKIKNSGNTYEQKCAAAIASSDGKPTSEVWESLTRGIKVCGLEALALKSIKCLMQGLTLEESLSAIVKAALEAMSIEEFGRLFFGLPPEKQAAISAIAKKQIEDENFFADSGDNQQLSDNISTRTAGDPPWTPTPDPTTNKPKTIMDQLDSHAFKGEIRDDTWLQAYAKALIETYDDDLIQVIDILNSFPGAPLIAMTLSIIGACPVGPIFDPSIANFINSTETPLCDNFELGTPQFQNPFKTYPKITDLSSVLFDAAKKALEEAIINIMMKMLLKVCQVFGSAACNTLNTASEIATSAGGTPDEFANIIKDAICGDGISEEDLNDTIEDLVTTLGSGTGVFATQESAIEFTEACSSNTTRKEMTSACLGECAPSFLMIIGTIIKYDYPELIATLGTDEKICKFFTNVGNLFPQSAKEQMRGLLDSIEDEENLPMNPSMCASPAMIECFSETRAQLLQGRATPLQSQQMCEDDRGQAAATLEDIAAIMQNPEAYIASNLPPLISDPGCDDGLIPYESEQAVAATNVVLSDALEQLRLEFIEDMLGDGGMPFTDADFGLLNMIMSDTSGNPLTVHNKKSRNPFVFTTNFNTNSTFDWKIKTVITDVADLLLKKPKPAPFQSDALPTNIGLWLGNSITGSNNSEIWAGSNNEWAAASSSFHSIEDLMGGTAGNDSNVDLTKINDLGYNVEMTVAYPVATEIVLDPDPDSPLPGQIKITYAGRKSTPDASMFYYDNAKGQKKTIDENLIGSFINGFQIDLFTNELEENELNKVVNMRSNNTRVLIGDIQNETAPQGRTGLLTSDAEEAGQTSPDAPSIETKYEFFAIDDTLSNLERSVYPNFERCFDEHTEEAPQLILLSEMMGKTPESIKNSFDTVNDDILGVMRDGIGDTTRTAYKFGATFDGLPTSAFDYMAPMEMQIVPGHTDTANEDSTYSFTDGKYVNNSTGEIGLLYRHVQTERTGFISWPAWAGGDGLRKLRNSDFILGLSRDQFDAELSGFPETARVFMLDPSEYGESYKRPAIAIKPAKNAGWVGFMTSVFPATSNCTDDAASDLVDFIPIEKRISDSYPSIPEDSRMNSAAGCEPEIPYYRILDRASKSGIEAVTIASIQIMLSAHFVKCMPVFTYIAPGTDNYSNIFNSYVVEVIEEAFLDAQGPLREFFNTFKDYEFWYAFLEQAVQLYVRLVKTGMILEVPPPVDEALKRISAAQEQYKYPSEEDYREALKSGDQAGGAIGSWTFGSGITAYRLEKNLEAIRATEEDAKIVFAELVKREFEVLSKRMNAKLESINQTAEYSSTDYWFLQTMVEGSKGNLKLKGKLVDVIQDVPSGPSPYYTSGGELYVFEKIDPQGTYSTGDDYVGFYYEDPTDPTKMIAGKEETELADSLKVYQNKIKVADSNGDLIGSITSYEYAVPSTGFSIRQVVEINGANKSPTSAISTIEGNTNGLNLSDIYPGTLSQVLNDTGEVVGLEGNLGVREGVILYYDGIQVASSFIDALDVAVELYEPATPSSRLLLCLIDNLFLTQEYKLLTEYIFPIKKFASLMAIYGDKALLPSIGETIYESSQSEIDIEDFDPDNFKSEKPGLSYDVKAYELYAIARRDAGFIIETPDTNAPLEPPPPGYPDYGSRDLNTVATYKPPLVAGNAGWSEYPDRQPGFIARMFSTTWDEWDKILMRNSKSRIKQTFKSYYFSRDFKPGDSLCDQKISEMRLERLRDQFKIDTAASSLPFWRWGKIRPYIICDKTEE
jgi:hypothetical protein